MDSLCASFPTTVPRLPQSDTGNRLVRELTVYVTWRGLYACTSLGLWSGRVAPTHCPLLPQPHRDTGQDPEAALARNPSLQYRVRTGGLISWRKIRSTVKTTQRWKDCLGKRFPSCCLSADQAGSLSERGLAIKDSVGLGTGWAMRLSFLWYRESTINDLWISSALINHE